MPIECHGDDHPLIFHDTLLFSLLILLVHVSKFNVYDTMTLPLKLALVLVLLHNISAAQYHNIWKKTFPFLKEIEKKVFPFLQEIEETSTTYCSISFTAPARGWLGPAATAGTATMCPAAGEQR